MLLETRQSPTMIAESIKLTDRTMTTTCVHAVVNDEGNLELPLDGTARATLECLSADPASASRVRSVVVQHGNKGNVASTQDELLELFARIGRVCSRLETLRIALDITGKRDSPCLALPIAALTAFFEQRPTLLASLKLSAVIAADGDGGFDLLEKAIRANAPASWKEVRMEFCEPAPGTESLDPLLRAFSSAATLNQVILSGTNITHSSLCTGPSLAKLVEENELKVLTIWGGKRTLSPEDTLALVKAVEANSTLRELTLHARGLCPTIGRALARCLEVNTTVERLILCLRDSFPAPGLCAQLKSEYATTATMLSDALRLHNRSLRLLSLDCSTEDEEILTMGDSHDFDFFDYELMDAREALWQSHVQEVTRAFTEMLHCNTVLETLWMNLDNEEQDEEEEEGHGLLTSEMDMLLRLNRFGIRKRLFEQRPDASNTEWLQALESQKDDLNALNYLLSRNPSLCSLSTHEEVKRKASSMEEPVQERRKRRKTTN